jgi:hypothetical protein
MEWFWNGQASGGYVGCIASPRLWTQAHLMPLPNIMSTLNKIGKGETIP